MIEIPRVNLYTVLLRGHYHPLQCEDDLLTTYIDDNHLLLAVMDGCSGGDDSHFASTLTRNLLRKIAVEWRFEPGIESDDTETLLREVLRKLFQALKKARNDLMLTKHEMLATLVIAVVNHKTGEGSTLTVGDGAIVHNGEMTEYDQNNRPDYLGYHLGESFETFYEGQQQRLRLHRTRDLSLCTDGLFTFMEVGTPPGSQKPDPIILLTHSIAGRQSPNMLYRKVLNLEREHKLQPGDDLAIVRLLLTEP